jgi:queuine tRNA-ribosyltransferase
MSGFSFEVSAKDGAARAGRFVTPHGAIETPIFMPVGTQAAVKNLSPEELCGLGAQIILSNTYHLFVRPGADAVAALGGLHRLMSWGRPILTDSGGFQVFSLEGLREVSDAGVTFRSHLDGQKLFLGPEESIAVQEALGADVIMAFDECPPGGASREVVERAVRRSTDWLRRCISAKRRSDQALFGIAQGGADLSLRRAHLEEIAALDLPGYALGGFSVGEPVPVMRELISVLAPLMPAGKPRYLMGVGTPEDLVESIRAGVDLFDCVMPTRNARHGTLFVRAGRLHLKNAAHARDPGPVEEGCGCYTCLRFSRGYLRHLFMAGEALGARLATIHNLHYYLDLVGRARAAITRGEYESFRSDFYKGRATGDGQ